MLSTEPANGAFFVDPAKRAAQAAQEAQPAHQPVAAEASAVSSTTHQSAAGPSAAMIDVPLGTLIFRAGLLGEEQLEDALREGMRTGRRLGEVLIERGLLQERDLGRLLAGQKGLPFAEISASDAEPAALEMLSEENARHQVALPLRHEGGQLVVAVADPSNELMLENLRRMLGAAPKLVVAPYAELVKAIGESYARPRPEASSDPETVVSEPEAPKPQPQAEVERAPVVRPLPIVLPPKERAAEPPPASHRLPSPPMLRSPVPTPLVEETSQVEAPVVQAIEKAPPPQQPAPEPEPAVQPAPAATPEPQTSVVQVAPAPELLLELPPDWPSAGEEPAEEPASPAPPPEEPAPEPPVQEEPASLTAVIVRLQDGTTLEVGTFQTVAEAATEAQEVVIEIAAADRNGTWPFFAQRYLRPDLIVSVDLVEESSDN
jgi:type IV pilus assembly protein PilB